jgi:hypothetical protein
VTVLYFYNYHLRNSTHLYPLCTDLTENTVSTIRSRLYPSVAYKWTSHCSTARFCGNVFSDPLRRDGHGADHIGNNSCNTFYCCCVRVFRELPRNASTCHNVRRLATSVAQSHWSTSPSVPVKLTLLLHTGRARVR